MSVFAADRSYMRLLYRDRATNTIPLFIVSLLLHIIPYCSCESTCKITPFPQKLPLPALTLSVMIAQEITFDIKIGG